MTMSLEAIHGEVKRTTHPDKAAFWFVRHAESKNNTLGENSPVMHDTPLTEKGEEQGSSIAKYLLRKSVKVTHVYSSDSLRGKGTADPIAQAFNLPVIVKPDLNERNWGEYKELPWSEVAVKLSKLSMEERFNIYP